MDQQANQQSAAGQTTGRLEFRVSRPGTPIRRLRLAADRYTLGRGSEATICLEDPALLPVHAILQRERNEDGERLSLRATAVPLLVNGRAVRESVLHVGDQFFLGEYQFEFVGGVELESEADAAGEAPAPARDRETQVRGDGESKPRGPRLSFADGMRLISEQATNRGDPSVARSERTLDAIERALSEERRFTPQGDGSTPSQPTSGQETVPQVSPEANARNRAHRQEMEAVMQRFAETQEEAASANRAIATMRQQVADLGEQLRRASETGWQYKEELDRVRQDREQAHAELQKMADTSQQLISELDAARRDRSEISSSLHDATVQLYTARSEWEQAEQRVRELGRQREEALQKVDAFNRRCEELSVQLQQAESACQNVSQQRDQIADQLRQRTLERDSAVALAEQHRETLAAKETVIDDLRRQVTGLETAVAESRQEAERLRGECQTACDSVARLEQVVEEGERQRLADRESWEAESAELCAAVERISLELANASSELTRSHDSADQLQASLNETRAALAEAEAEADKRPSEDEWQAIRHRLEATEQQLRALQAGAVGEEEHLGQTPEEPAPTATDEAAESRPGPLDRFANEAEEAEQDASASSDDASRDSAGGLGGEPEPRFASSALAMPLVGDAIETSTPTPTSAADTTEPAEPAESVESTETAEQAEMAEWAERDESLTSGWPTYDAPELAAAGEPSIDESPAIDTRQTAPESVEALDPQPEMGEPCGSDDSVAVGSLASELLRRLNDEPAAESAHGEAAAEIADAGREEEEGPTGSAPEAVVQEVPEFNASGVWEGSGTFSASDELAASSLYAAAPAGTTDEAGEDAGEETPRSPWHEQGEASPEPPASVQTEVAVTARDEEASANTPGAEEDDDSIEAYMNRLLQRVQGGRSDESNASSPQPAKPDQSVTPTAPEPAPEPPVDENAPYVPRSQAPERSQNLAAMRELANSSARTAIMSSVRRRTYSSVIRKFVQAGVSTLASCVMLYYSQFQFGWQLLAAICLTLLAANWVIDAWQLQVQLREQTAREAKHAAAAAPVEAPVDSPSHADAASPDPASASEDARG